MTGNKKYLITDTKSNKSITRWANSALEAIEKITTQYKWNYKLKMVDADTRGYEWAKVIVDKNGGINFNDGYIVMKYENA